MAFQITRKESVQKAVRRIAGELLRKNLVELDKAEQCRDEVVHAVRKRCKRLRGLLRLVRPSLGKTYSRENQAIRDAARLLSTSRDARSMIDTYDDLLAQLGPAAEADRFAPIRTELVFRLRRAGSEEIIDQLSRFGKKMAAAEQRLDSWELSANGFAAIEGGLRKTHRQARCQMEQAWKQPTSESLHEFRKQVKYHLYHVQILQELWPALLKPYASELSRLGSLLGEDHNLAVLRTAVEAESHCWGEEDQRMAFLGLLDQRRKQQLALARPLGRRLFAESSRAWVKRIGSYWKVRAQRDATAGQPRSDQPAAALQE
ncbi:MAG: CHAD domain-containing protein [Planctomycetales bacterium]|nr:CHAD domain-containing protein [Planctomycetales bacterium]